VSYDLHDQPVRFLKGKLRLRQVTRLCDNGHQTQVITIDANAGRRISSAWSSAQVLSISNGAGPPSTLQNCCHTTA